MSHVLQTLCRLLQPSSLSWSRCRRPPEDRRLDSGQRYVPIPHSHFLKIPNSSRHPANLHQLFSVIFFFAESKRQASEVFKTHISTLAHSTPSTIHQHHPSTPNPQTHPLQTPKKPQTKMPKNPTKKKKKHKHPKRSGVNIY